MRMRYGIRAGHRRRGLAGVERRPRLASSHREAPAISEMPKVDATDFYMFRSYAPGAKAL
jgi:hypothetical protein